VQNFAQMYESVEEELITAGVATLLDEPVWMNTNGDVVKEEDTCRCKVTIDITKLEICIVADEVGGNTSQEGDGLVGGELMLTKPGQVAQRKISTKDKHYTLLGLTLLTGDPLICVVIMAGDNPKPKVETGIDFFVEQIGASTDRDYIINNTDKGRKFPGGPTCIIRRVEVPCFVRWSTKGSMTSEILRGICVELDFLQVFDCSNAMPFFLLNGHGSRIQLPFLEYVNNPLHSWCAYIGVPYGTSTIEPYEIIPIINKA